MNVERKQWNRRLFRGLAVLFLAFLFLPGASIYYHYSGGRSCGRCHEIWQPYTDWHTSTHRDVACSACHGDVFTLDAGFHLKNIHRLYSHLRGEIPEQVRLKPEDVRRMGDRCRKCHQEEYADWAAGPHSARFRDIFLDGNHNRQQLLVDDCLRCHGSYFDGGIRELVAPLDMKGPWRFRDARVADQPAIPCLTCHQIHREGPILSHYEGKEPPPGSNQQRFQSSLAWFDRRELDYVSVGRLPLPVMHDGEKPIHVSPDIRQALCYQCHAPLATLKVGSGDDRSAIGVHEGLSCFACHQGHGLRTRPSCSTCHPQLSNCGLNVETMDTTFKTRTSTHNIHFVKCADCHTKGVPRKKLNPLQAAQATGWKLANGD